MDHPEAMNSVSEMESLQIDPLKAALDRNATKKQQKVQVCESWEDEELDSGDETPTEAPGPSLRQVTSNDYPPGPPPPTPISPSMSSSYDWSSAGVLGGGRPQPKSGSGPGTPRSDSDSDRKRPEKTTAAAGRMIAAGLGMKAPKKTEEQRQYDRSIKEQEIKRRNREKGEEQRARLEDEKAKAAVWN